MGYECKRTMDLIFFFLKTRRFKDKIPLGKK